MSDIEADIDEDAEDVGPGETLLVDLRSDRRKLAGRLAIGEMRLHWRHHGEDVVFDLVAVARLHGFDVRVAPLPVSLSGAGAGEECDSNETESH